LISPDVLIGGLGAVTCIGRTALATAAAVRAGVSGFSRHGFMVDAAGKGLSVGQFPWLLPSRDVASRIADALVAAVREALAPLQASIASKTRPQVSLLVNLPSPREGLPATLAQSVVAAIEQAFGGVFDKVRVAALGHAGGVVAIQSAAAALASGSDSNAACIVVGADSYLDPGTLEWLEQTDQLHGAGERNNAWGFVPGEGAGALLLLMPEFALEHGIRAFGRIAGIGLGREAQLAGSGEVCLGLGLTAAVRTAVGLLAPGEKLSDVYCDMNGEVYRADEFAFTVTRTRERFVAASDFAAPADCWGDVGAASVPLAVVVACIAGAKGYAKGERALVWASSVTGERGAVVIHTRGGA
jgi:3-oxoacyl-[acyl-carrier-protein] synthase I